MVFCVGVLCFVGCSIGVCCFVVWSVCFVLVCVVWIVCVVCVALVFVLLCYDVFVLL